MIKFLVAANCLQKLELIYGHNSQECIMAMYQNSWDSATGNQKKYSICKNRDEAIKPYVLFFTTLSTKVSWIDSSIKSLPAAMQFSPLLKNTELIPCRQEVCGGYNICLRLQPNIYIANTIVWWYWGKQTILTALSRSQSLKMMRGDFPPSSRETFFTLLTAQLQDTQAFWWFPTFN